MLRPAPPRPIMQAAKKIIKQLEAQIAFEESITVPPPASNTPSSPTASTAEPEPARKKTKRAKKPAASKEINPSPTLSSSVELEPREPGVDCGGVSIMIGHVHGRGGSGASGTEPKEEGGLPSEPQGAGELFFYFY